MRTLKSALLIFWEVKLRNLSSKTYRILQDADDVKAVNASTEHLLLSALDHRAATCEKLEQLQLALRDARRMIDLKPNLSKVFVQAEHHIAFANIFLRVTSAAARYYSSKERMSLR